ncbi:hypothetical protein SEUBUCD646_0B02680 [Saccharomyces eubayanus]|uniref:Ubiquitin-protein ligase n=2 Tax=Saccharomyces TaxID=4930 RepID=A0A6C1E393_SACPS|nr:Ubiquitin-protein ligase [Saccharomyces pastorianus]CAI1827079.1 hypothetical protein SEUBUCD650_0B02690 [Saccharomyces eubayanus]CAI1861945.1 hypothetical protein SEUBUCD646_0B02680 [Saccharomyces eubayanus]
MSESNQGQDRSTNLSPNNIGNGGDSNGNGLPPNTNAASTPLNNGTEQTRNITVSIQYSYFTPERLAQLSNTSNNENSGSSTTTSSNTISNGAGPSFGIGNGGHQPDGALVLSFRDVPASTPQDRLNSFISVAAQLAMERFNRLLNRPKGITKEEFDKLPVLKVADLPETEGPACSICYEEYEEEDKISKTKRKRESKDNEEESGNIKKQKDNQGGSFVGRTGTADESTAISDNGSNSNAATINSSSTPLEPNQPHTANDEETNPSYKHSPIRLPCGHVFGRECLYKWSRLENSCPLCRHKISESAGVPVQQDTDEVAANEAAFERIRRVLYDPAAESNNDGTNTETTNPTVNPSNTTAPTIGNANSGEQILSRTGFFLMPQNGQTLHNPVHVPSNNSDRNISNGTNSAAPNLPSNATALNNNQNPRWVPIPLTLFQFHSPNPSDHPTDSTTTSSADANDTGADATSSQHNRLRAVLDHIFNVAQGGSSDSSDTAASTTQTSQNQGTNGTTSSGAPHGSSFLENISRLTGHFRNSSSDNHSSTNNRSGQEEHAATSSDDRSNLFSSGVASYRNQNGDVTTVELNDSSASTNGNPSQDQESNSSNTTTQNNAPNDNNEQRST